MANAVLFVLFSQKVRNNLWRCLLCRRQVVEASVTTNTRPSDSQGVAEDHFLFESLDNTSLLVEFDSSSSRII